MTSEAPVKGFASLMFGLLINTIGIDPAAGFPRFTFGSVELLQGISFIPAMIGMFALSEILRGVVSIDAPARWSCRKSAISFTAFLATIRKYWFNFLRGSVIGVAIGALPGAGGDIAAWISYAVSKRFSKEPEKFGTGHIEGIIDATSANNAALGGAWIPALVFGIPGDSITAIVIGVLYMKGMNPGPTVFLQNPQFIYAVFIIFILANLLLLPLGWIAIKSAKQILRVPRNILMPIILIFCVVGSYAMTNSTFGIIIMMVMGIVGWLMEENGFPIAPAILGLVLGEMLEQNFMTSMIKADGNPAFFFERPIAAMPGCRHHRDLGHHDLARPAADGQGDSDRIRVAAGSVTGRPRCAIALRTMPERSQTVTDLAAGIRAGDRATLARAITLIESKRADHRQTAHLLVQELLPLTGKAVRLGITGAPGAGKSTTIDALGTYLTGARPQVAVLAVDPSSSRTGGSILGDKTRMARLAIDDQALSSGPRPPPARSAGSPPKRARPCCCARRPDTTC